MYIFGGGGANFRGKLEKALRINFMVLKILWQQPSLRAQHGTNDVYGIMDTRLWSHTVGPFDFFVTEPLLQRNSDKQHVHVETIFKTPSLDAS